jgi:hypothetical protein
MDGNRVVCPHQIDLGEKATTRELVGVIMYGRDGSGMVRVFSAL